MKRLLWLFVLLPALAWADKPSIDPGVFNRWGHVTAPQLSNDGKYAWYRISAPAGTAGAITVMSTQNNWKLEFADGEAAQITPDNRRVVVLDRKKILTVAVLGGRSIERLSAVASFKIIGDRNHSWLAYLTNDLAKTLTLRDLQSGKRLSFTGVTDYSLNEVCQEIVLIQDRASGNTIGRELRWVHPKNGTSDVIWSADYPATAVAKIANIVFDSSGMRVAFFEEVPQREQTNVRIWHYEAGSARARVLVDARSQGIEADLRISAKSRAEFGDSGKKLYFSLVKAESKLRKADGAQVDIWNYKDAILHSKQLNDLTDKTQPKPQYAAVVDIRSGAVVRLQQDHERLMRAANERRDDFVLVADVQGDIGYEWNWNAAARKNMYLVSVNDGRRTVLEPAPPLRPIRHYELTADRQHLLYYDADNKNYFSYAIVSGETRNITQGIDAAWTSYSRDDEPASANYAIGVGAYIPEDSRVLLYEQHDIWLVDLTGKAAPINLTNGYGRKHNLLFRIAIGEYRQTIKSGQKLILSAFDLTNKSDGYFSVTLGRGGDPQRLVLQPYIFNGPPESWEVSTEKPRKARDAEAYVVRRMDSNEFPNYFFTTDFKKFSRLTNYHPEKNYNWLTTELVNWKSLDGRPIQGILYKPENFDPNKKYPVIFHYYEIMSDRLHEYLLPELPYGPINIPYFVSNGYLVFTPDIHFTIGKPGESSFNAVVSAAQYMARQPWVDAKKMAIQGHSWGGFQTYYIAVHTDMFAAAMSSAGMSNLVTCYGSIIGDGSSRQRQYELYRGRIGATLWNGRDLYLENSPVFLADKMTTPILMMHNKEDGDVPYGQSMEFFTAARRLGKKAWMLQYDGEGHLVFDKAGADYIVRLTQFFDHYLKDAPPPKWMTEGVPARLKGIEAGFELDASGKTP